MVGELVWLEDSEAAPTVPDRLHTHKPAPELANTFGLMGGAGATGGDGTGGGNSGKMPVFTPVIAAKIRAGMFVAV